MKKANFRKLIALALTVVMAMSMLLLTSCGGKKNDGKGDSDSLDGKYVAITADASFDEFEIDGDELTICQEYGGEEVYLTYTFEINEDGEGCSDAEEMGIASIALERKECYYDGDDEDLIEQVEMFNEMIKESDEDELTEFETFLRVDGGFYIGSKLYLEESVYEDIDVEDAVSSDSVEDGTYIAADFEYFSGYRLYMIEVDGDTAIISYAEGITVTGEYEISSSYISFYPTEVEYSGDDEDIEDDVDYANECIEEGDYCDFEIEECRITNDDKGIELDYTLFVKIN